MKNRAKQNQNMAILPAWGFSLVSQIADKIKQAQ
jgi:hypothetical protein